MSDGEKKIIAVVDDPPEVLRATVRTIKTRFVGAEVVQFGSSTEFINKVYREFRCDILVTDFEMPGLDGGEVVAEIRRLWIDWPIFVYTGCEVLPQIDGATGIFRKPREAELLLSAIARSLGQ